MKPVHTYFFVMGLVSSSAGTSMLPFQFSALCTLLKHPWALSWGSPGELASVMSREWGKHSTPFHPLSLQPIKQCFRVSWLCPATGAKGCGKPFPWLVSAQLLPATVSATLWRGERNGAPGAGLFFFHLLKFQGAGWDLRLSKPPQPSHSPSPPDNELLSCAALRAK